MFQDFQSGSGAAGIHFVSIVNLSDWPVEFCAAVAVALVVVEVQDCPEWKIHDPLG